MLIDFTPSQKSQFAEVSTLLVPPNATISAQQNHSQSRTPRKIILFMEFGCFMIARFAERSDVTTTPQVDAESAYA